MKGLIEDNLTKHTCKVKSLGALYVPDCEYGDLKLNVFPFEHTGKGVSLPVPFDLWNDTVSKIMENVPLYKGCNNHYCTIDSKFFTVDDFLRREGVHIDGNFCADPNFSYSTWGGTRTTWGGTSVEIDPEEHYYHIHTPWVSPYNFKVPLGNYVSDSLGGILCASSLKGCRAWEGEFYGKIGDEGCFQSMVDQLTSNKQIDFEPNKLYFMTSNTPHETLKISKGSRRTFIRITLNHNYPNSLILDKNSKSS